MAASALLIGAVDGSRLWSYPMWQVIKAAWHDLSKTGRAVIVCVLALAVAGLLALAMWLGYDLSWLPRLLGAE